MAIIVGQEEKKIDWLPIIGVLLVFIFLVASTYYLFFSPTPLIERIIPAEVKTASEISEISIDAKTIRGVFDEPVFKSLQPYVPAPVIGSAGRANPFLPY